MVRPIGENYAMCTERTKPSGGENRSPATQRLHRRRDNKNWDYFTWKCVYSFYPALVTLE